MPAPAPGPLRLRRCCGGLRGPGPGCGFGGAGPGLAHGGPGCGPVVRLGDCAGSPPVGPAAAAPRGPPLRRGRARRPGGPASPAAAVPGPLVLRPPPGLCGPPLRGWGALGPLRGPLRPSRAAPGPPCLAPAPQGGGGPSGPRASSIPGAAGRPKRAAGISRRPRGKGFFPGGEKGLDRMEHPCYYGGAGSAMRTPPSGQKCPPVVYRGPCWAVFLCLDSVAVSPQPPALPPPGGRVRRVQHTPCGGAAPRCGGDKKPGRGLPRPGKQNLHLFC